MANKIAEGEMGPFSETRIDGIEVCQGNSKIIYLTFDDGIQPGTAEVFDLLRSKGVHATFFLTGAHALYNANYEGGDLLRQIYEDRNFLIGNHSNSHANNLYDGYYQRGGLLLPTGQRRSVVDDFRLCDRNISNILGISPATKFAYARLPGRNTWRVDGLSDRNAGSGWGWGEWGGDSGDEADALRRDGYQIFGWDLEWEMDFGGTNNHSDYDADVDIQHLYYIDPANPAQPRPVPDNYPRYEPQHGNTYRRNPDLDRIKPNFTPIEMLAKIYTDVTWGNYTRKKNKLILLMHERAFRRYTPQDPGRYLNSLETLIDLLQRNGYSFDLISNY